jgi:hypothetical protein
VTEDRSRSVDNDHIGVRVGASLSGMPVLLEFELIRKKQEKRSK